MRGDPEAINRASRPPILDRPDYPPEARLRDCETCGHPAAAVDGAIECWTCGWTCLGCQSRWCSPEREAGKR